MQRSTPTQHDAGDEVSDGCATRLQVCSWTPALRYQQAVSGRLHGPLGQCAILGVPTTNDAVVLLSHAAQGLLAVPCILPTHGPQQDPVQHMPPGTCSPDYWSTRALVYHPSCMLLAISRSEAFVFTAQCPMSYHACHPFATTPTPADLWCNSCA